jgi:hypothetical protein
MQKYRDIVQNLAGDAVTTASVYVYNYGTSTLATIYSDNGVTTKANPFTVNTDGTLEFYAANGRYSLTITDPVLATKNITDLILEDPNDSDPNLVKSLRGLVVMQRVDPTATNVSWVAYKPDGTTIDISATQTDGFAEAHAYAQANNHNLSVNGGGINLTYLNANVIAFLNSSRQTIGPFDSNNVDILGVNFTFAGQGLTSGTAVTVDSFSKGRMHFDGQIVCNHAGIALEFKPTTNYDGDTNKNQGVSGHFYRVVENDSNASGAVVVQFNAQDGCGLHGSKYRFMEINGGLTCAKFLTAGSGVITGCHFDLWGMHGFANGAGGVGLDVGTGVSGCGFNVEITTPVSSDYTAKINSAQCDYVIRDLTTGTVRLLLDTAASGNEIHVHAPSATGLALTDNSTAANNSIWFNGRKVSSIVLMDPTGDTVTSGNVAARFKVQARNTSIRDLLDLKVIHRSTNGTAASLKCALRIADALTDVFEFDASGNLTILNGNLAANNFSGSSSGTNTGNQTITLTGDVTGSGTGSFAATIANNAVTNAKAAQMATHTIKGNNTGSTASAADLTPAQVAALFAARTVTVLTSGSGTYTTPANCVAIKVRGIGGGSGSGGNGTSPGNGGNGGNTTFGTLTGNGATGSAGGASAGGTGGTATNGDINITGADGGDGNGAGLTLPGLPGPSGPFGGGGAPSSDGATPGRSAKANTGSGAGSPGLSATLGQPGTGAVGGYFEKLIASPSATYSYAVGAGGTAGTAGTGGQAGGAGGSGIIIVEEFYV